MAWGRIDDKLYSHRKTMRIPRAHRCEAMGLWTLAISWANNHGTDGHVPRDIWDEFGTTRDIAQILVDAGYWIVAEDAEDGYVIANFGEYNLTSEDLVAKREAEAERKRRWRASKNGRSKVSPEDVPVGQQDMSQDVPTESDDVRPASALTHTHTHTQKNSSSKSSTSAKTPPPQEPRREDVEALCAQLRDRIVENGNREPAITKKWRTEARLLLDKDGVELSKAIALIDWCQADSFWKSNIMSMPTFREKYDRLRSKAIEEHNRRASPGPSRGDQKVQNILDLGSRLVNGTSTTKEITQ